MTGLSPERTRIVSDTRSALTWPAPVFGLPILQRLMGHADSSTTLGYIQLSMTDIADEYRRVVEELQRRYRVD